MKRFIYFLIPVILSLVFIQCYAFIVPDVKILGKDPEITGIEPKYLIPGNIGKIKGNNFFEFPQNANKLFINNKRVKILKSTNDTIEFIVPKIKLGNANIRFYTKYLGYESKSVTNSCKTTFNGPILSGINTNAVSPGTELQLSGNFSKDKDLFLNINGVFLKAKELSKNSAIFLLPDKLPEGIFKINGFYRIYDRTKTKYFDSAPSEDLILFNVQHGQPLYLKINLEQNLYEELNKEYKFNVSLTFNNKNIIDVTNLCELEAEDKNIVEIKNDTFKFKASGGTKIKASLFWQPTNTTFTRSIYIHSNIPRKPEFMEIIIDEVFPFASGLITETDANMDGFAKLNDEFVEIKNLTDKKLDLSECSLFINENIKPEIESLMNIFLEPNAYLALFGNYSKEGKLNLSNSGSSVEINCSGETIDYIYYPSGKNGDPSWQRESDFLNNFIKHPVNLFSPGGPPPEETNIQTDNINTELPNVQSSIPSSSNETENNNSGAVIKEISVIPNILNFTDRTPQHLQVISVFPNGEQKDITSEAKYTITGQNPVIKIDQPGIVDR